MPFWIRVIVRRMACLFTHFMLGSITKCDNKLNAPLLIAKASTKRARRDKNHFGQNGRKNKESCENKNRIIWETKPTQKKKMSTKTNDDFFTTHKFIVVISGKILNVKKHKNIDFVVKRKETWISLFDPGRRRAQLISLLSSWLKWHKKDYECNGISYIHVFFFTFLLFTTHNAFVQFEWPKQSVDQCTYLVNGLGINIFCTFRKTKK